MSLSSDNFTALIHLRDQARKWKNITFVTIIAVLLVLTKVAFSDPDTKDNVAVDGSDYIASIDIDGVIFSNKHRSKILKEITQKNNIKAVIVNINSPGGGIVGSEILHNEILKLSKKKPVVVVLDEVAASGGYMVAVASNHIIARHGTLTGSIGVILQSAEVTQMADKLGIKFQNYKSSHFKGAPSPFEKTDPAIDDMINESVVDGYKFFTNMVLESRKGKIAPENIAKVTDGRIFTGSQALAIGLIDEIGGEDEALSYLRKQYKISSDLEIKEISLKKSDNKLIDKILNSTSSIKELLTSNFPDKKLMAIW